MGNTCSSGGGISSDDCSLGNGGTSDTCGGVGSGDVRSTVATGIISGVCDRAGTGNVRGGGSSFDDGGLMQMTVAFKEQL